MATLKVDREQWDFGAAAAAMRTSGPEPDTKQELPRNWRVYGKLGPETVRITTGSAVQSAEPLVSPDVASLSHMPDSLQVGDHLLQGRDMRMTRDTIDFDKLFGGHNDREGHQAFAIAEMSFPEATELIIGAGSDWWVQVWIDGREVLSTLATGSMSSGPPQAGFCFRHRFEAGRHLMVGRSISGGGRWVLKARCITGDEALISGRDRTRWELLPQQGLMLPPKAIIEPSMAIRTDLCVADETVECDFDLHNPEGQFGIVFGAQDRGHFYWAYYPRWGQNWRARAFYAVIGRVDGTDHVRGLAMMLMPNVVTHWNASLSMKVERRGGRIQMYVNGVKGPVAFDATYGAGRAGVLGHTNYEVRKFKVSGRQVDDGAWPAAGGRTPVWHNPDEDTGYGRIGEPYSLMKFDSGEIVAAICRRRGGFFDFCSYQGMDPGAQVRLYLSQDAGRTWQRHGEAMPMDQLPANKPWGIRWFEPLPGVIRAFKHGPAVSGEIELLKNVERAEDVLTFRDSHDRGLTWSEPEPATLVGNWSRDLYRKGCWNHLYGFTELRDGTLLALFLHGYNDLYKRIPNHGHGTWGTEVAQPYVSRSEDNGATWQEPVPMDNAALFDGQKADSPNGGFSETALAQLPNGRIVATCRPFRSPYSWLTWSEDDGRTWRISCYAPYSLSGGPQMMATASGYLALVARQAGLGMHTSLDGGLNWDAGTMLDHDCWFNGFLVETEPDVVLVFYYNPGRDLAAPSCPRMQRVRITEDGPVPADD